MFITPSFKKSLIVEQFQGNYLNREILCIGFYADVFAFGAPLQTNKLTWQESEGEGKGKDERAKRGRIGRVTIGRVKSNV